MPMLPPGPFTVAQARAAGLSETQLARLLSCGLLTRLRPGVLVDSAAVLGVGGDLTELHRLLLRGSGLRLPQEAFVSHESAAVLHGLALLGAPPRLALVTRPKAPARTPDRTPNTKTYVAGLVDEDRDEVCGLPVTTAARTVVDLARRRSFRGGVVTADAALRAGVAPSELAAVLRRCAGWPGIRRARDVVGFADGRAESVLESIARVAFREMDLPAPRLQVMLGGGRPVGRVDFYWDGHGTVGEADGRVKYEEPDDVWDEKRRQDALRDLGLEVVRITWADVTRGRDELRHRILGAFARAARLGAA